MKASRIVARVFAMIGLAGIVACHEDCCVDYDHQFCVSCENQGKIAYECNYDVQELWYDSYGVAHVADRSYRLTGCYASEEEATRVCMTTCEGFYACDGYSVTPFYCDGVDNCEPSEESATAGAAPGPDCSDWLPAAAIGVDPTGAGGYLVDRSFFYGLLSDPRLIECDATTSVSVNVTSPGFTIDNVDPGSLPDALGLQAGDVPVSLNGQPLGTLDDVRNAAFGLANATSFQLQVLRGTAMVTLDYQVQ